MAEGMTYKVCWEKSSTGWKMWVRERPRLAAQHAELEKARRGLEEAIGKATGDCEPVLNFDPPLPGPETDARYLRDGLMVFYGSGYTDLAKEGRNELYSGPPCVRCRYPTGPRGGGQIRLTSSMSEDVGFPSGLWWHFAYPILVSERFLALLTPEERTCVEWRECLKSPGTRKRVFEVIPRTFVRPVMPAGMAPAGGWRCDACGRSSFRPSCDVTGIAVFVARAELPHELPPLFGVGDWSSYKLAGTASRISELLRHPHSKGMDAGLLGVVEEPEVERMPALRACDW